MTDHSYNIQREAHVSKKIAFLALVAIMLVAFAAPAFASEYTRANGYFSGPHGGYTTTTNKCADCHSAHKAAGSFMLMKADSREAACDFCHGGGGGSSINIMMDNAYRSVEASFGTDAYAAVAGSKYAAAAIPSSGNYRGTGHTLGYTGSAPVDINPAFTSSAGLACFDCHTPHGNTARILTTFSDPGRAFAGPGQEGRPTTAELNGASPTAFWPIKANFGNGDKDALLENGEWGVDYVYGNFVWDGDATASFSLRYRPIWPTGRFLLKKNPDVEMVLGVEALDTDVTDSASEVADNGENKFKIDWAEPLGPADNNYGGYQDNDNDNNFPFAPKQTVDTDGNGQLDGGFLSVSEFCVDCHDGTGGASTQPANIYDDDTSAYTVAYSHDTQPRH
jgi:hypothetical protein